jgi:hypothetical protein
MVSAKRAIWLFAIGDFSTERPLFQWRTVISTVTSAASVVMDINENRATAEVDWMKRRTKIRTKTHRRQLCHGY